jgi:Na+/melibiose symporter-like transporter
VELARRLLRRLAYSGWAFLSAVLAFIAGVGLVGAISESNSEENRAPAARIAIAAIALLVAVITLVVVVQHLRGKPVRISLKGGLILTWVTVLLIFVGVVVGLASGRL